VQIKHIGSPIFPNIPQDLLLHLYGWKIPKTIILKDAKVEIARVFVVKHELGGYLSHPPSSPHHSASLLWTDSGSPGWSPSRRRRRNWSAPPSAPSAPSAVCGGWHGWQGSEWHRWRGCPGWGEAVMPGLYGGDVRRPCRNPKIAMDSFDK